VSDQKQKNNKEEKIAANKENILDLRQKQIEKDLMKGRELILNLGRGLYQDYDEC
jgi:hypothetical protein